MLFPSKFMTLSLTLFIVNYTTYVIVSDGSISVRGFKDDFLNNPFITICCMLASNKMFNISKSTWNLSNLQGAASGTYKFER